MKQHAVVIAAWAGLSFACGKFFCAKDSFGQRLASVAVYGFSMLTPLGLCCLWLWHAGVFARFNFWTIDYAREYVSGVPLAYAPQLFWHSFPKVISIGGLLWLTAAAGLIFIWLDARWKNSRGWLLGFCAASALAVCPDFYFRKHYFLIALPAAALLAGATVSGLRHWWGNRTSPLGDWPSWSYALVVVVTILTGAEVWFQLPMPALARKLYGADPLPEAEIAAKFISENSAPTARVAILGSEPEIYFLAHRHSATGYIYTYALMEPQPFALKMQREMISDIETQKPEFVVFADNIMSWNRHPESNPKIFAWWDNYKTNYTLVGLADIISPTQTICVLGTNYVAHYPEAHGSALEIYQRK